MYVQQCSENLGEFLEWSDIEKFRPLYLAWQGSHAQYALGICWESVLTSVLCFG